MDKNDIIEYVMNTPHNTNRAVLSSMLNQLTESGGGGGDGYLGLHTATVNVTFDTSSISSDVTEFESAQLALMTNEGNAIDLWYGLGAIPVTELGSVTQMLIPVKDEYITSITPDYLAYLANGGAVTATEITVVSGAATQREYDVAITGDCSLNIKVEYQG